MTIARTLGAVALIAALTGCSTLDAPTPQPSSTPIVEATQARETGLTAPARPFGGDCAALMTEAEASVILGGDATLLPAGGDYAPEFTVEVYAGISCQWIRSDYVSSVRIVALPAAAVGPGPAAGCAQTEIEGELQPRCAVEATVNGIRISGFMWFAGEDLAPLEAAYADFSALFEERANSVAPPPVPIAAAGAWAHPVDCAAIIETADLSAVSGLGAAAVGMPFPFGSHFYATPAENELAGGHAEFPYCWIEGESATVTFVALGGARWLESSVTAGATPFAIDGYESAYTSPGQEGLTKVDIFDGPNWLHFQIRHTSNAKPLADALFAALDTTAAP